MYFSLLFTLAYAQGKVSMKYIQEMHLSLLWTFLQSIRHLLLLVVIPQKAIIESVLDPDFYSKDVPPLDGNNPLQVQITLNKFVLLHMVSLLFINYIFKHRKEVLEYILFQKFTEFPVNIIYLIQDQCEESIQFSQEFLMVSVSFRV